MGRNSDCLLGTAVASSCRPGSVAGPGVAIGRRDVAAAIAVAVARAVVVIEPVAAEPVRAPKTAAKASAEVASGKMAAAKMSAATTACERNGGGRHHCRADGERPSNDNHRFVPGVP